MLHCICLRFVWRLKATSGLAGHHDIVFAATASRVPFYPFPVCFVQVPTGRYVVPTGRVIATDSVIVATSGYVVPAAYDISPVKPYEIMEGMKSPEDEKSMLIDMKRIFKKRSKKKAKDKQIQARSEKGKVKSHQNEENTT
ncbi:hypothetical protein Tco_0959777 [Tanacetum coccineum]